MGIFDILIALIIFHGVALIFLEKKNRSLPVVLTTLMLIFATPYIPMGNSSIVDLAYGTAKFAIMGIILLTLIFLSFHLMGVRMSKQMPPNNQYA